MNRAAEKRKVLVLSTGGTIGMGTSDDGSLAPKNEILKDLLTWVPELQDYAEIHIEVLLDMDSSLITPDVWLKLAHRIEEAQTQDDWAGVVVLHGTDTLAFTASALSFLLPALRLPVVLTGGQRPLHSTRTDARNNIIGAVESALEGPVEVMVFFHNRALRGNRATKAAIADFDGFDCPNFPPLGNAGIYWEWRKDLFWPQSRRPSFWPGITNPMPATPLVIPWMPGLDIASLKPSAESHWALILEAFGTGNMPFDTGTRDVLASYIDGGGLVFIKSQVVRGQVALAAYAPGKVVKEMGITAGADMTREAMVTKLMVLKCMGFDNNKIKAEMSRNLAGELTERLVKL